MLECITEYTDTARGAIPRRIRIDEELFVSHSALNYPSQCD